jgi:peptidyl-prolyl cis-trans isomerase C
LNELILQEIIRTEAINLGISVSSSEIEQEIKNEKAAFPNTESYQQYVNQAGLDSEAYKFEMQNRLLKKKVIQKLADTENKISEKMMRDYYEKNIEHFQKPETREMQHISILLPDTMSSKEKEMARNIMGKIANQLAKGLDMHDAREKYQTPGLPIIENIVRDLSKGVLTSEIENALFNLKAGEISSIITDKNGLHIIECLKIDPPGFLSYESCAYEIMQRLQYLIFSNQEKQIVEKLKAKADIRILEY